MEMNSINQLMFVGGEVQYYLANSDDRAFQAMQKEYFMCHDRQFYILRQMYSLEKNSDLSTERQRRQELNYLIADQHNRNKDIANDSAYSFRSPTNSKPTKYKDPSLYKQYRLPSVNIYSKSNLEGTSDRTDIYLNNCDEIIKNLRELKNRKQKGTSPPFGKYETPRREEVNRYVAPYYPRSVFSSSGTPYNKQFQAQTPSRSYNYKSNKMKALDDTNQSRRGGSLPSKSAYRYSQESLIEDEEKIEEKQPPKLKSILIKPSLKQDAQRERRQERDKVDKQKMEKQYKRQRQENRKHQNELLKCLSQLTKYLQRQNKPAKPNRSHDCGSQIEDDQQEQQLPKNNPTTMEALKMKALLVLRSINEKSETSSHHKMTDTRKSHQKMPTQAVFKTDRSKTKSKQSRVTFILDPVVQNKREKSKDKETIAQSDKKGNEQLIKLLAVHLDRQQGQKGELTSCLKELTEYLHNQNEEIQQQRNKNSKILERNSSKDKNSQKRKVVKENKLEKEDAGKFQEAILKRLKKARMRGNMFKEKVETFRKEHQIGTDSNKKEQSAKRPSRTERSPRTATAQPV